jgi:hypothetical protein
LQAICGLGTKIDAGTIANLQAELAESRRSHGNDAVTVSVTQQVNQQQAQQQQQQQVAALTNLVTGLASQLNAVHQGIVQIGTGNAATPTNTQTNVR